VLLVGLRALLAAGCTVGGGHGAVPTLAGALRSRRRGAPCTRPCAVRVGPSHPAAIPQRYIPGQRRYLTAVHPRGSPTS
jgi:hypothetical protein